MDNLAKAKDYLQLIVNEECNPDHIPEHSEEYRKRVYLPIREAIKNKNVAVIDFVESLDIDSRYWCMTALEHGMRDSNVINEDSNISDRLSRLLVMICKENDIDPDKVMKRLDKH